MPGSSRENPPHLERGSSGEKGRASMATTAIFGAGVMGETLLSGLIRSGRSVDELLITERRAEHAQQLTAKYGVRVVGNEEGAAAADVLVLVVKPQDMDGLLGEIRDQMAPGTLVVSLAAGITTEFLESRLPEGSSVVRVMPNTPALVGASASAFALGKSAAPEDAQFVQQLFSSVGVAYQVKESLLDAVTGLSGSGPAYMFVIIEALSDGGVAAGLPREIATKLAAQTMLGSAKMVLETGQHPGALKDMVASPGGTTIEGLHELEKGQVRAALMNAVRAAAEKSKKLGQG